MVVIKNILLSLSISILTGLFILFFSLVFSSFWIQCGWASEKDEAIQAAKDAAYKQSGLEFRVDEAKDYGKKSINKALEEYEIKKAAGTLGFIAKTFYRKKLVVRFKRIEVSASKLEYKIMYGFRF